MRRPVLVVVGVVLALAGLLFALQGFGVLSGNTMSNSAFWAVAGPLIALGGLAVARIGSHGSLR